MRLVIFIFSLVIMSSKFTIAETIQIDFTADDSYSIEVAKIGVGDTIEWLPKNEGHNVEFLGGPDFNSLPEKSDLNAFYSVTFNLPGVYLYHCTPHGNMGMLGLVIVGNDFHNLKDIEGIELSRVAKLVLQRLIRIAKSNS
jgi:pseudoazurin